MKRRDVIIRGVAATVTVGLGAGGARSQTPRVRREVNSMQSSDPFFANYARAIKRMHELPASDGRNWRNQALVHLNHCKHSGADFPHWHRHYLANFEAICVELSGDPGFALPYWNWSSNQGRIPDPFYDLADLDVAKLNDPSNASSPNWGPWPVNSTARRGLPKGRGLLDDPQRKGAFTADRISAIQSSSSYPNYVGQLEGSPHNTGHVVAGAGGGHMGDGMSPLDPIFWLHHCNVDRLWAQWQDSGNKTPDFNGNYSGNFVDAKGQPVMTATSAGAQKIASFGYTYDTLTKPPVAATASALGLALPSGATATPAKPAGFTTADTSPALIASLVSTQQVHTGVETRLKVQTNNLPAWLAQPRAFWSPATPASPTLLLGSKRVLARIKGIVLPANMRSPVVNVFVDCPYLSPDTPADDPHYADSFGFFGKHEHAGHMGGMETIVDLTAAVRRLQQDGKLQPDNLNVQLMAIPAAGDVAAAPVVFTVGGIELIAA